MHQRRSAASVLAAWQRRRFGAGDRPRRAPVEVHEEQWRPAERCTCLLTRGRLKSMIKYKPKPIIREQTIVSRRVLRNASVQPTVPRGRSSVGGCTVAAVSNQIVPTAAACAGCSGLGGPRPPWRFYLAAVQFSTRRRMLMSVADAGRTEAEWSIDLCV